MPTLEFTAPESYRVLLESGFITPGAVGNGDVLWLETQRYGEFLEEFRPPCWKGTPKELIIFAETHGGEGWCWDTSTPSASGEFPIVNVEVFFNEPQRPNRFLRSLYAPSFPVFVFLCILDDARKLRKFRQIEQIRIACSELLRVADPSLASEIRALLSHLEGVQQTDDLQSVRIGFDRADQWKLRIAGVDYGKRVFMA